MAYIEIADLKTHLYAENVDEITREDDSIISAAIATALGEAKSKLSRFNLDKLFNPDATGFVNDVNLKHKVKDMACYHLLTLCNVNIDYEIRKERYEFALKWLSDVRDGKEDPDGWPYKDDDEDTDYPEGSALSMYSGTPRRNHIPYSSTE